VKIAILRIGQTFYGVEKVTHHLISQLKQKGVDVELITNSEMIQHFSDIPNLKIHDLGKLNEKNSIALHLSFFKLGKNLDKLILTNNFSLIHVMSTLPLLTYLSSNSIYRVNYIVTLHGKETTDFVHSRNPFYLIFKKIFDTKFFNKSKGLTSVSRWLKEELPSNLKYRVKVIENGVNTKIFHPYRCHKEKKTVLFIGRLIKKKGIIELVELANYLPQYKFYFVGDGPLRPLINLKNTRCFGYQNQKDLIKNINSCTICVFPSHNEPFGLVGLEAMACGKAIIATKKGFSEYIQNKVNGIIIEPKDKGQLLKSVLLIMENKKYRKKLEYAARNRALNFDWKNITSRYIKYYKSLMR
jgi:glycosyltransferase involved in cell wall biosynthesis